MTDTKKTILIAENDPLVRKTSGRYLSDKGYHVLEAGNGKKALELFRAKKPDMLITDLRMPELDGMELIKTVVKENPAVPVIIFSGMGTMTDVIDALRIGAWDYLTKPITDLEILHHSISKALKHAELLQQEKDYKTSLEEEVRIRTIELLQHNKMLEREMKKRQAQEDLVVHAKQEWERTVDAMPDMIAIVDKKQRIIRTNKSMQQSVGHTYEEIIGQDLFKYLVNGEELYAQTMEDGLSHNGEFYDEKLNCYLKIITVPYTNPGGELAGAVYIARDITDRKEEQANYARLFESSQDAIVVTTKHGFINCNQAALKMFGYTNKEEFLKLHPADVSPPLQANGLPSLQVAQQRITEAINGSGTFFLWEHQRKDGSCFPAEVLLSPFEQNGEMVVQGVVRDLSEKLRADKEKEKLQSQLLHAQKLESVGQLAAGIAHEINTPTQFIGSNVDFLDEANRDIKDFMTQILKIAENAPEDTRTAIEDAVEDMDWEYLDEEMPLAISQSREGVKRVTSIVQAMKEFSHPGSKNKELLNLNQIINTTVTVARNEWKYVAEVDLDLDPNLPKIPLLADEMGQVILNMLVNAAHAIADKLGANPEGDKGIISISTKTNDTSVELHIKDSGKGIPEESLPRIFDPFYTTKKVGKGTGQGLAISHDVIVEKHQGTISVESTPDQGTTFIIQLPLKDGAMYE